jgi:hypothetical protein
VFSLPLPEKFAAYPARKPQIPEKMESQTAQLRL